MRALTWVVLLASLAVWSLFALGVHGLVEWLGNLMASHADIITGHPETVAWIGWAIALLRELGGWMVVLVWAIGAAGLLAGAWLLRRRISARRPDVQSDAKRKWV